MHFEQLPLLVTAVFHWLSSSQILRTKELSAESNIKKEKQQQHLSESFAQPCSRAAGDTPERQWDDAISDHLIPVKDLNQKNSSAAIYKEAQQSCFPPKSPSFQYQ